MPGDLRDTKGRPVPPAAVLRGVGRRHEDSSSLFHRKPTLTAEQTSEALAVAQVEALLALQRTPLRPPTITPDRLARWHRAIFGQLFSRDAGRLRRPGEDVAFPVTFLDEDGAERDVLLHGAAPREITARVRACCDAFSASEQAFAERRVGGRELGGALAEVMGCLLRTHPFVDGNHRTAFLAMQAVMVSVTGRLRLLGEELEPFSGDLALACLGGEYAGALGGRLAHMLQHGG